MVRSRTLRGVASCITIAAEKDPVSQGDTIAARPESCAVRGATVDRRSTRQSKLNLAHRRLIFPTQSPFSAAAHRPHPQRSAAQRTPRTDTRATRLSALAGNSRSSLVAVSRPPVVRWSVPQWSARNRHIKAQGSHSQHVTQAPPQQPLQSESPPSASAPPPPPRPTALHPPTCPPTRPSPPQTAHPRLDPRRS